MRNEVEQKTNLWYSLYKGKTDYEQFNVYVEQHLIPIVVKLTDEQNIIMNANSTDNNEINLIAISLLNDIYTLKEYNDKEKRYIYSLSLSKLIQLKEIKILGFKDNKTMYYIWRITDTKVELMCSRMRLQTFDINDVCEELLNGTNQRQKCLKLVLSEFNQVK